MKESDSDIRKVLRDAEASHPDDIDRGIEFRQMLVDGFRGKMRWATLVLWAYGLGGTALAVFSAVRFFAAQEVRDLVLYAALFLVGSGLVAFMKLWYWTLMNRNTVLREVKRLELRVAELADKS